MAFFNKNSNLADQAVARGKTPDNGTIGPNARANTDPKAFMNGFVSKWKDQPEASSFSNQAFSAQSALDAQDKYSSFGSDPQFSDPGDVALGKDFLNKYWQSALLNDDEKVDDRNLGFLMAEQPDEAVGSVTADKMKVPGSGGTAV
jgi:hypothetical protein